jgi:hypothetical protein
MRNYLLILLFSNPLTLLAAQQAPPAELQPLPEEPPPPPEYVPPPPTGLADEGLEPEVKIIKRNDAVIREYRINGRLYLVRVEPRIGPPYYLYDRDGNGSLEFSSLPLEPAPVVPNWMIHRW